MFAFLFPLFDVPPNGFGFFFYPISGLNFTFKGRTLGFCPRAGTAPWMVLS